MRTYRIHFTDAKINGGELTYVDLGSAKANGPEAVTEALKSRRPHAEIKEVNAL
jgi:hypothetical protein